MPSCKQYDSHFRSTCTIAQGKGDLFYVPRFIIDHESTKEKWILEFSRTHCSIIGPSQPSIELGTDTPDKGSKRYISLSYDGYDGNYAAIEALCSKAKVINDSDDKNFIIAHGIFIALLIEEPVFFGTSPNARSNWIKLFNDPFLKFLRKFYRFHYFCDPTNFNTESKPTEESSNLQPDGDGFYYSQKQKEGFAIKWIEALINNDGEHNHWLYSELNFQPVSGACAIKPDGIFLPHETGQKNIEKRMEDTIHQLKQLSSRECKSDQERDAIFEAKKPPSQISHTMRQTIEWFKKRYSLKLAHKYSAKPDYFDGIQIRGFNKIRIGFGLIIFIFFLMGLGSRRPHLDTQFPYNETLLIMIFWATLLLSAVTLIYWLWSTRRAHLIKLIVSIMIGNIVLAQGGDYFADLIHFPMEANTSSTGKVLLLLSVDLAIALAIFFYLRLSILSSLSRYESERFMSWKSASVSLYGLCVSMIIAVLSYPIFRLFDDKCYSSIGSYIAYLVSDPLYFWWMILHWSILALFIGLFLQMFWQNNTTE